MIIDDSPAKRNLDASAMNSNEDELSRDKLTELDNLNLSLTSKTSRTDFNSSSSSSIHSNDGGAATSSRSEPFGRNNIRKSFSLLKQQALEEIGLIDVPSELKQKGEILDNLESSDGTFNATWNQNQKIRVKSRWYKLAVRSSSSNATQQELVQRSTFILMCLLTVIAGMIWGSMYLVLGETTAATMPFAYSALNSISLVSCTTQKRYDFFVKIQLLLILVLPYAVHLALGGLQKSGGVLIWSFLAPLGSAFFSSPGASLYWFQMYVVTMLGMLFHEFFYDADKVTPDYVAQDEEIGYRMPVKLCAYWAMNIVGVTTIVFFAALTFARELKDEYGRSEKLLLNILPGTIAKRIKCGELPIVDNYAGVTILFADLVGFTKASSEMCPNLLIGRFLRDVFSVFDKIVERHKLEKIKTIGDAYMVVAGLSGGEQKYHTEEIMMLAAEMFIEMKKVNKKYGLDFKIRIGVHTGPVIAGVLGVKKFAYDVWGDAVNTASRMESHGKPGYIHISEGTYQVVRDMPQFDYECMGESHIKGLGTMKTYTAYPLPKLKSG